MADTLTPPEASQTDDVWVLPPDLQGSEIDSADERDFRLYPQTGDEEVDRLRAETNAHTIVAAREYLLEQKPRRKEIERIRAGMAQVRHALQENAISLRRMQQAMVDSGQAEPGFAAIFARDQDSIRNRGETRASGDSARTVGLTTTP